jgi:hypothetical protein
LQSLAADCKHPEVGISGRPMSTGRPTPRTSRQMPGASR